MTLTRSYSGVLCATGPRKDRTMSPMSATSGHTLPPTVVIRRAVQADRPAVERLAALDSARIPRGDLLLALVDDAPWAALSVHGGEAVADPFRPSAEAVDLL